MTVQSWFFAAEIYFINAVLRLSVMPLEHYHYLYRLQKLKACTSLMGREKAVAQGESTCFVYRMAPVQPLASA